MGFSLKNLNNLGTQIAEGPLPTSGTDRLLRLKIDEVEPKEQIRKDFVDIEGLAASIKAIGLQQPIVVLPKNAKGKYIILQGERRWRACKLAEQATIAAIVRGKGVTDEASRILAQLSENIQRSDMNPCEIGQGILALKENGMTLKAIAERLGKSPDYTTTHAAIAKLPASIDALRLKEKIQDAYVLLPLVRMVEIDETKALKAIEAACVKPGSLTRVKAREMLAALKEAQGKKLEKRKTGQVVALPAGAKRCNAKNLRVCVTVHQKSGMPDLNGFVALDMLVDDAKQVVVYVDGKPEVFPASSLQFSSVRRLMDADKWARGR